MLKRLTVLLLMLMLVVPGMLVQAQELPFKLAVRYQDGLYVVNTMPSADNIAASLTQVYEPLNAFHDFRAVWSPDGTKLAYIVPNSMTFTDTLMVWDGTESFEVTSVGVVLDDYPIAWTRDGRILYISNFTLSDVTTTKIFTVAPEPGATPDLLTDSLEVFANCGIGTMIPMEGRLWNETSPATRHSPLALTDYGLVFPSSCGVYDSLYRSFSAETVALADGKLRGSVLSSDETKLAGINGENKLVVIDLATLAETPVATTGMPRVLAWGKDGSLYYVSTTSAGGSLFDGLTPEQLARVTAVTDFDDPVGFGLLPAITVRLYRIAPDGTETLLVEPKAYTIGRLEVTDNAIVYSTIADGSAWLQAILDGTLTADMRFSDAESELLPTSVNYLPLNADGTVGDPVTLPGNLERFTAR